MVELLIVIAVLVIAAAIVIPSIGSAADTQAVSAARVLGSDLEVTRSLALTTQQPHSLVFKEGRLIEGLEIVLETMPAGKRVTAILPPEKAWGEAGVPPAIPANSFVVFDLELLSIE